MKVQLLVLLCMLNFSHAVISKPRANMSLEQAVERVKKENGGRVLSAKTSRDNSYRGIHKIRILTPNGKVKRYQINEQNGSYIRR